jgi:hypothetical protein
MSFLFVLQNRPIRSSTSSFINIFHDYLSWSYSCKTDECDFYTVTRNSQSEHYPMYKMIWLDNFVVQIRNLYTKQPIRTLYPIIPLSIPAMISIVLSDNIPIVGKMLSFNKIQKSRPDCHNIFETYLTDFVSLVI